MQFLEKDDRKRLILLSARLICCLSTQFVSDTKNIEVNHKGFIDIKTDQEVN